MGQIRKETLRHQEAFQIFCALGGRRSYPQVAGHLGVSVNSINKWARSFDWKRRVEEHDATLVGRLEKEIDETIAQTKARYHRRFRAAIDKWFQANFGQPYTALKAVKKFSAADIVLLTKLDLLLMGEADLRIETSHDREITELLGTLTTNELREIIAVAKAIRTPVEPEKSERVGGGGS
jgi:transposase